MRYIITLLIGLAVLQSCKKLDTTPTDFIAPENYFNTEADLNASLTGVYSTLSQNQVYGSFVPINLVFGTDEIVPNQVTPTVSSDMFFNRHTTATSEMIQFWRQLYKGVYRANLLLDNVNKPKMDSTRRANIMGQALFLRSYYFFLLANNFGGVPMPLNSTIDPENLNLPRVPLKDCYEKILEDMVSADSLVNTIDKIGFSGRVSRSAVRGIIARVCLAMAGEPVNDVSKYQMALDWAKKVDTDPLLPNYHTLNASYSQIFINQAKDVYETKESIWEAEIYYVPGAAFVSTAGPYGSYGTRVGIATPDTFGRVSTNCYASSKLFFAYTDTLDVRFNWNASNMYYSGTTEMFRSYTQFQYARFPGKWRRKYETAVPRNLQYAQTNGPILRYADVLLMQAEAENEVNGATQFALDQLNAVRRRANATPYSYSGTGAYVITGQAMFKQVIQDERLRELCFEGLRKMDLVRWGLYVSNIKALAAENAVKAPSTGAIQLGSNTTERNKLFPIPQYELDINPLINQNPGF